MSRSKPPRAVSRSRRLHVEPLEDRRLLAVITVTNNLDEVNGDTSSIANLMADDGGDGIALREAIEAVNENPIDNLLESYTVQFGDQLTGETIILNGNELNIRKGVSIDATMLSEPLTISGNSTPGLESRIFSISEPLGPLRKNVLLAGLILTGGRRPQHQSFYGGGAIQSSMSGILILDRVTVIDNHIGQDDPGGGIYSFGPLVLKNSIVKDNSTIGAGGGIYVRDSLKLIESEVINNQTLGETAEGGGIRGVDHVTIIRSTISGNATQGVASLGGGISVNRDLAIYQSTISGNGTIGDQSHGAGIAIDGRLTILQSTIADNYSRGTGSIGGGVYVEPETFNLRIENSIIAQNAGEVDPDIHFKVDSEEFLLVVNHTLIGNSADEGIIESAGPGNIVNENAFLGPLADNGGPTKTHALLPGSPVIDMGYVESPELNLARYGLATQSSDYHSFAYPADLAIDGFVNVGNFTHTLFLDEMASWQVDLGSNTPISEIVLHNRVGYESRLRDITVEILDENGTAVYTSPLLNPENILGGGQLDEGPEILTIDLVALTGDTVNGRTVRVSRLPDPDLSGSGGEGNMDEPTVLSLAEVEVFGIQLEDQRGKPRIADGDLQESIAMDIGAYEAQTIPSADYVDDGTVDGFDFLAWQRGFGKTDDATRADGNSDDDTDVDHSDLAAWQVSYGSGELSAVSSQLSEDSATRAAVVDAALAGAVEYKAVDEQEEVVAEPLVASSEHSSPHASFRTAPAMRSSFASDSAVESETEETAREIDTVLAESWLVEIN